MFIFFFIYDNYEIGVTDMMPSRCEGKVIPLLVKYFSKLDQELLDHS